MPGKEGRRGNTMVPFSLSSSFPHEYAKLGSSLGTNVRKKEKWEQKERGPEGGGNCWRSLRARAVLGYCS